MHLPIFKDLEVSKFATSLLTAFELFTFEGVHLTKWESHPPFYLYFNIPVYVTHTSCLFDLPLA